MIVFISGGAKNSTNLYLQADRFAKHLADEDYEIDIEDNTVALTKSGMEKAERMFNVENLYDLKYVTSVHHINNALKANYIMQCDKEYMVSDDEVLEKKLGMNQILFLFISDYNGCWNGLF